MNLQDIKYFEKLLDFKDKKEVANYYQVTPEMITNGIRNLTNEVGEDLFTVDEKTHRLTLNKKGRQLHQHFSIIVDQFEQVEREINPKAVKVGIPPLTGNIYFPKFVSELVSDTIKNVETVEAPTVKLLQQLSNKRINLTLIGSLHSLKNANLNSILIQKRKLQLIVNKNNPLAKFKKIKFSSLANEKFVLMPDDYLQAKFFNQISSNTNIFPQIIYRTTDVNNIINMIKLNLGVSLLLSDSIKYQKDLVAIELDQSEDIPNLLIYLVWLKNHTLSKNEKRVVNVLETSYKQ